MSGANEERGEHELELAGIAYRLRPSFAAVRAIEKKLGKSIVLLARAGNIGDVSIEQLGIIAAELIRAGAEDELTRKVSAERIAELIYEAGLPHVMARITVCLIDAAVGGRTASGEAKAGSETSTT